MAQNGKKKIRLELERDGRVLVEECQLANTMGARMLGLMFRPGLADRNGIWLEPCNSVHTFFMSFAIDIVFVDREKRVKRIVRSLAPWRFSPIVLGARAALELNAGRAEQLGLAEGDQLRFREISL